MDVDAALARLGLDRSADIAQVKRSFRRLAHDLHPDRGGDGSRFAELSRAYQVLLAHHEPRPAPPRVSQGRPSRTPTHTPSPVAGGDLTMPLQPLSREELSVLRVKTLPVHPDVASLARLLMTITPRSEEHREAQGVESTGEAVEDLVADDGEPGVRHARLRTVQLIGRSPGARRSLIGPLLFGGPVSTLRIGDPRDTIGGGMRPVDVARRGIPIVLTARGRGARRAVGEVTLDPARLGAAWRRERGDTSVRLQTQLDPISEPAAAARSVTDIVERLLDGLAWPLTSWVIDPESIRG